MSCARNHRRAGFTLVEMLVVLAILAITTTIAVQSLAPVASEARYDATTRTLNSAGSAIASTNQSAISGFVADTGRLPGSVANGVAVLEELLVQPSDLPPFTVVSISWDPTNNVFVAASPTLPSLFTVPVGWRGPYLMPSAGATSAILDGWGQTVTATAPFSSAPLNPFSPEIASLGLLLASSGDPNGSTGAISLGMLSTSMQNTQINVSLYTLGSSPRTNPSGKGPWVVTLFSPGPATNITFTPWTSGNPAMLVQSENGVVMQTQKLTSSTGNSFSFQFPLQTVGPRVICAADLGASPTSNGPPVYVNVLPGATQNIDLYVP